MMRKNLFTISFLCLFLFIYHQPFKQVITYFPPDEQYFFQYTILDIEKQKENYRWIVKAKTNEDAYLLQQTSLIYADGYFIAYYNDWEQATNELQFQKKLEIFDASQIDTFALYHAEFHRNNEIYSIEEMLTNKLKTNQLQENETTKQLETYKKAIFNHLSVNENDVTFILLTDLPAYIWDNPIWSYEEKERLAGHLTESIYKQYIIRLMTNEITNSHFIPAFIIDHQEKIIYFIFQLEDKWYYFKQNIPS